MDRLVTIIDRVMHAVLACIALFVIAHPALWSYS